MDVNTMLPFMSRSAVRPFPPPVAQEGLELEVAYCVGGVISPLLGNVYLHHVLDLWFEIEVKPRLRGRATLVRYCDDFIIGLEREDDARRVMEVLGKRLGRFGLSLHPDKTRLVPFRRPPVRQRGGKGPATFDFLGFTLYWRYSRNGRWGMWCKTRSASLRRAIQSVYDWCRSHRHQPVKDQHEALSRRLRGHFNYFGVSGNFRSLQLLVQETRRAWYKWLCRRSQRKRLTWERFEDLLRQLHSHAPGSPCGSGDRSRETHPRRSRMVETSSSGSGEGPGWATAPGYSTAGFSGSDNGRSGKS